MGKIACLGGCDHAITAGDFAHAVAHVGSIRRPDRVGNAPPRRGMDATPR
jgi:hypothetical protein